MCTLVCTLDSSCASSCTCVHVLNSSYVLSIPRGLVHVCVQAWTEFDEVGRMKPSSFRDRAVDVAQELFKFALLLRGHAAFLVDRHCERGGCMITLPAGVCE